MSNLTSVSEIAPILKTSPILHSGLPSSFVYFTTSLPNSAYSITGKPYTDLNGSPMCKGNSKPLTIVPAVYVTRSSSVFTTSDIGIANRGCSNLLRYSFMAFTFSGSWSFSPFQKFIAPVSNEDPSPIISALNVFAPNIQLACFPEMKYTEQLYAP